MKNLKFWQTNHFKALERRWYERLESIGFKDAEEEINGNHHLKQRASNCYRAAKEVDREAKYSYYSLLQSHYQQETFQDDVERLVIERRSEGVKIKQISEELKTLSKRCHRETIRNIIRKYEIKWGIRKKI